MVCLRLLCLIEMLSSLAIFGKLYRLTPHEEGTHPKTCDCLLGEPLTMWIETYSLPLSAHQFAGGGEKEFSS